MISMGLKQSLVCKSIANQSNHHLYSPYKYLKSLSKLQLGWGQTSLVCCHSVRAPLLKESDVVINTSVVTLWRELFLYEGKLKMFPWVFLTLFTFWSANSKLPLKCNSKSAFTPPAQQSPWLDIHQRIPDKNGKNPNTNYNSQFKPHLSKHPCLLLFFGLLSVLAASTCISLVFWWCESGDKILLEIPSQCWTKPSQLSGLSP